MTDLTSAGTSSRGRMIAYWTTTVILAFIFGAGGVADFLRIEDVVKGMTQLGYPVYFCVILGVWKILGAATILAPGAPRLKEWAYAGFVFDLTGASASHFAMNDDAVKVVVPLVFTVVTFVSWATRPANCRLAGPLI